MRPFALLLVDLAVTSHSPFATLLLSGSLRAGRRSLVAPLFSDQFHLSLEAPSTELLQSSACSIPRLMVLPPLASLNPTDGADLGWWLCCCQDSVGGDPFVA